MLKALGSRLTYANVMATVAVFLALGGGAYALSGIPDRGGVFHGCVSNATGVLRVVKSARSCQKAKTVRRGGRRVRLPGEFAVSWDQQGPPGKNGVNGVNGVNGINGTNGTNGTNGATNVAVKSFAATVGAGSSVSVLSVCDAGQRAVSGGVSRTDGSADGTDVLLQSAPWVFVPPSSNHIPMTGETPNGWKSAVKPGATASFTYFVVCASP